MAEGSGKTDQAREEEDGEEPRGEINPVKVVLMFLSVLIAAVHVCVRQCSSAIGSLGYRGE